MVDVRILPLTFPFRLVSDLFIQVFSCNPAFCFVVIFAMFVFISKYLCYIFDKKYVYVRRQELILNALMLCIFSTKTSICLIIKILVFGFFLFVIPIYFLSNFSIII